MERRIAIKNLGFIAAGVMLLPSCVRQAKQFSITLKNIVITGDQEALLAEIVQAIIPATETPGAKDLNVHQFVLRMVDDCHGTEQQLQFVTGLAQVEGSTKRRFNKSFADFSEEERITFLREVEEKKDATAPELMSDGKESQLSAFYSITKRHTIQGYLGSEYIMSNVLVYNMMPGRFNGCIQIKDKNDIQTVIG